jgi:S-adenosylmethionine:tRNA-ribosyltransferase-isomerase (queuine synthetase)
MVLAALEREDYSAAERLTAGLHFTADQLQRVAGTIGGRIPALRLLPWVGDGLVS